MIRVCFVCLGNICRSPTAAGVMQRLVDLAGLGDSIEIDSAGTSAYHVGEEPDPRSTAAARVRGITLRGPARQLARRDFDRFDYVLVADRSNLRAVEALAPAGSRARVALVRSFDPESEPDAEVPDPYYGGDHGFDEVLDLCDAACRGLLERIRSELSDG